MTFNCNGVRAAARKGFFDWLRTQSLDVICLQETRAQIDQLTDSIFHPEGFHCYYFDAQKKGYSGTAIYSKKKPLKVSKGLGFDIADIEGRYIQADYEELSVASLYLPSGSANEERLRKKYTFMDKFLAFLRDVKAQDLNLIVCADWNICHKEIDLKNWKANQKNSGFLPEEREWLDILYDDLGFVDAFRVVNQEPHRYSWWSNRGQARSNNVGWRLDYQVVTPKFKNKVISAEIYVEEKFSDHAPVILTYDT
jgi:exodeoxyribonuclease-3